MVFRGTRVLPANISDCKARNRLVVEAAKVAKVEVLVR